MITNISAGPATEPLTLDDAKLYIRSYATDGDGEPVESIDDVQVQAAIAAARVYAEQYTGKYLITQTVTQTMDCFPSCSVLKLTKGPVQSVTSIAGLDAAGEETEMNEDDYVVDAASKRVVLKSGKSFPAVTQVVAGAVVEYVAGYGDAEDVPAGIVQALRHLVAHFYVNRETDAPVPPTVLALLAPFRVIPI